MTKDEKLENFMTLFRQHCQLDRHMNMNFTILRPGVIEYTMPITENHLSSPQTGHGGALSCLMDATLGMAALSEAVVRDCICSTVEFKLNFLRPLKLGDHLTGKAQTEYVGKKIVVTRATIYNQKDEIVSLGQGTFNFYPLDKRVKISEGEMEFLP